MSEPGRKVVVAFAVLAVFFGLVAQRSDVAGSFGVA
jgi:hypothetical protein